MLFKPRNAPAGESLPLERLAPEQLAKLPLAKRLLALRGETPDFEASLKDMLPPTGMKDLQRAVKVVAAAIDRKFKIVIVADYDADGATACAIGLRGFRMFGADVDFVVPNRFTDGYGLSPGVVDRALEKNPRLIVTVDNGIAAVEGIRYAREKGVPVVVTDHHLAGDVLPDAVAIVNPNQPGCEFPSKNLAGCGVMFYLLIALRRHYADLKDPRGNAPLQNLFDILALGTVADVVKLDRNNRILVEMGLRRIRQGKACPGIHAIFTAAGKKSEDAGATDLGFYIGPRINAAGRMDDASVGIQCLVTDDWSEAIRLATELNETNTHRREVQAEIQEKAEQIADGLHASAGYSIVVADPEWHEGVIGVVAGRIKEKFQRPTIVFTQSEDGAFKGSGRSIPALHLRDALDLVDRRLPGVILKFGGHAMAAGLSIQAEAFEAFRAAFEQVVRETLSPEDLEEVVEHDGALQAADLTIENARWMKHGVWGQGFPAPSFLTPAKVVARRILKDTHTKLTLDVDGEKIDGILFNEVMKEGDDVLVYGRLDINEWNGKESVQMLVNKVVSAEEFEHASRPHVAEFV